LPVRQGFTFEWKAWLIAYDEMKCGPDEFNKLTAEEQIMAMAYGAATWWSMKNQKKISFDMSDIGMALMKASKADNLALAAALRYAQFPDWMKSMVVDDDDKKKANVNLQ
jgi:hypothetical protein